jgi:hypothetical protein
MSINKQSPTKYSGYGAQLGHGVIDDPAVVDPLGDDIDADALKTVRRLQARGEDKKKKDKKKLKEGAMSVTRNDIRRLVNEALDEMSMMGGPGGMRRQRPGMCLYVTYGGGVFYFVAPCPRPGASEEEAAEAEDAAIEMGREVTSELDPEGRGMANAFDLYSWLQDHDEITHVHDFESVGGTVPKKTYMIQVREVGQEEGLFPPDDVVNEAAFPEELEGVYGAAPPEDAEEMSGETGDQMLFIMPRGFRLRFYLTDYNANPLGDEAEDVTEQILPASMPDTSTAAMAQKILAWLDAHPEVGHVYDEEIHDSTDDDSDTVDEYRMHLEGLISDEGGLEADEGGGEMDFVDYETGADDVPYGAADVALRMGRGYRTDEGDFDPDVGYIDDPKSARHGKPMKRRSADDEPLNEARWAKLAGILKG